MREGMAPASMTALVWRVEPDAIFVNTHAASNYNITINIAVRRDTFGGKGGGGERQAKKLTCSIALEKSPRNWTSLGRHPRVMTS